jgi:hypothetical protein
VLVLVGVGGERGSEGRIGECRSEDENEGSMRHDVGWSDEYAQRGRKMERRTLASRRFLAASARPANG